MPDSGPDDSVQGAEDVQILAIDTPFQGYFRIDRYRLRHRRHDGGWTGEIAREIFERGHAAAVLLYDPVQDCVVLLNQFRIGAFAAGKTAWQTEVVAGIIESGEDPAAVATRETEEESGLKLRELIPLYHYLASPGGSSETIRLYCGIVDSRNAGGIHGLDSENEDILVTSTAFAEAWSMVQDGRIDNAPSIIALQWLALNRQHLRQQYTVD